MDVPGNVPGQAITTQALSKRLARHGVRAGQHRLAALHQLAARLPAPILADILGVSSKTADAWARAVSRGWTDYPAMRSATL